MALSTRPHPASRLPLLADLRLLRLALHATELAKRGDIAGMREFLFDLEHGGIS